MKRTERQRVEAVRQVMSDLQWHTVGEVAHAVGCGEPGTSAFIRDLRKEKYGNWEVETRGHKGPDFEYRMTGANNISPDAEPKAAPLRVQVTVKLYSDSEPVAHVVELPMRGVVKVCDGLHIGVVEAA